LLILRFTLVAGAVMRLLAVAMLLLAGVCHASGSGLRAGAAQAVITPTLEGSGTVYLAGFGHNRLATGKHDDLTVRCLALNADRQTVVVCAADLIGLFYEDVLAIRQKFAQSAPAGAFLIVAATHTHAGPDTLGLYGPRPLIGGVDQRYLHWVEDRIAGTAVQAVRNMQPARIEFGRDDHPLLALLQGVDRPPIVKDPFLFAMRISERSTGRTIATLVNWSDHPEVLGRKNTEFTADYPHWVRAYMEQQFGGIALFFSGAIGKVSPLGEVWLEDPETPKPAEDGTWRKAELLGTQVGRLAERALKNGTQAGIDTISIRRKTVDVPLDNVPFRAAVAAGVFGDRRPLYSSGKVDAGIETRDVPGLGRAQIATGHGIRTEVDFIQLRSGNTAVAEIATVPGEIYPELVNGGVTRYTGADFPDAPIEPALREQFSARYQFIFGLGNDEIGYLIPKAEWDAQPPWLNSAPTPWYGEVNSVGPNAAGAVLDGLAQLIRESR
jgi:hypothetical protein